MKSSAFFDWHLFDQGPVVGIMRGISLADARLISACYHEAGLYALEVTLNTARAAEIISTLRREFPTLGIGAGTVCTLSDLEIALDAGAQFIVTPILDEAVIAQCVSQDIPVFPGAFSPTEIFRAAQLGASAVKVFPASVLGPVFVKDLLGPLDRLRLIPTGGVSRQNIRSYLAAGAFGVGMGGSLFDKKLLREKDEEGLKQHFRQIKAEIGDFLHV